METIIIPEDLTGDKLAEFLIQNKSLLITQKKCEMKRADAFGMSNYYVTTKGEVKKGATDAENESLTMIKRTSVINTTNWFDSHKDVHFPNIWKKSLQENREQYLCQEHSLSFKGIISDEVQAFTKRMTWQSLGINIPGETEALIFVSDIHKSRNEFMFEQYRLNRVKNHSVGMQYVTIELAINNDGKYYIDEKENWDKYIDKIANKQAAIDNGYFWAVTEAKVIEGSAVVKGSNIVTPTIDNFKTSSTSSQPDTSTGAEAADTEKGMVLCPGCTKRFHADEENNKCPDCGQFVSLNSTIIETPTFDLIKAITETQFI